MRSPERPARSDDHRARRAFYGQGVDYPWAPVSATGVGSLPFDDRDEAARIVVGELPDFPHLAELPGRGAGADLIGRSAALLVELHVDLQPSGWRVVDRAGADERRSRAMLRADVDALEIAAHGYEGPLKVQVAGPLTLAAGLERSRGDRMLADHGARRELAASLAEGAREHVAEIARRMPGAQVVLQVDEPSLPTVLAGGVPTISGWGRLRSVDVGEAETLLAAMVSGAGVPVVFHCCAGSAPVGVFRRAGAVAVSLDPSQLDGEVLDELAAAVDTGMSLWPGVVPSTRPDAVPTDAELADRVARLWRRLDQDPAATAARTVVTPACGLGGADTSWARQALTLTRNTARAFADIVGGAQ